jgi:hypothetical protein
MDRHGERIADLERQLAEHAAEVMRAFGPGGPKADVAGGLFSGLFNADVSEALSGGGLSEAQLSSWCFRNAALPPLISLGEVLQLLEQARLVRVTWISSDVRHWGATQVGLAALALGKEVVRQRITELTGVTPQRRSVSQRLQELETLRATGAISDAEYTAKRTQIIDEI